MAEGGDLHEISRAIGALESEARRAGDHRKMVYKKLEEISSQLSVVPGLASEIATMKPVVAKLEKARQRRLAWLSGLMTGTSLAGAALYDVLQRLFTKGP